jgi:phytoene synthase
MTATAYSWESNLVDKAVNAAAKIERSVHLPSLDERLLEESYRTCETLTAQHSRTFSLAARLLPTEKRSAIHALYAFCRTTDDMVDRPGSNALHALEEWRKISFDHDPTRHAGVAPAWIHTRLRFQVPLAYADQLIEGVSLDLTTRRYRNFHDLAAYCYGVASTVGLMYMHIVGYRSQAAVPYAVRMGVALQMTNILRDVAEDWRNGRLYLPLDELAEFHLSEEDIQNGRISENWRRFMRFQIARIYRLYQESMPGIAYIHPEGQFALIAAADLYRGIMRDIESHDFDVFSRRAHLSGMQKISRIPALWLHLAKIRRNTPHTA